MPPNKSLMASLLIVAAILIWSSLGIVVRLADTDLRNTIFFPALAALTAQTILLAVRGEIKPVLRMKKHPFLLFIGPVFLMNSLLFYYAFTHTTIANAVLTHYTAPIFVAVLSPFLLREPLDRVVVIAIVLSSTGLWMMLDGVSLADGHAGGIAAGALSGLTYAIIIFIGRVLAQHYAPLAVTVFQNLVVVVILLPFIREVPVEAMGYLILMGLVHSTAAPLLYIRGLRDVRASKAAVLGYLEPVGAVIFALLIFQEYPKMTSAVGGVLIVLSGYLTIRGDRTFERRK